MFLLVLQSNPLDLLARRDIFLVLTVGILCFLIQLSRDIPISWIHEASQEMMLVFLLLSVGFRKITFNVLKKIPDFRTQILLLYLTINFLIACTLALVYILVRMYATNVFAFNFFTIYLFFTSFDIYSLIANLRQISEGTLEYNKNSGEELHENH